MSKHNTYSGVAALENYESLLLALNDAHVLSECEITGGFEDTAAANRNADDSDVDLA